MKRTGYLFNTVCSFGNLYEAFKKAFQGSGRTPEACQFHFNLENELVKLKEELRSGTYYPAQYRYFKIFDPKERIISVAPFKDRVVHHALVRVLDPIFDKTFIYDSYATRKGKGTHRAVKRAQIFLKKQFYYLKIDIAKYFDTVDHAVLLNLVRRKVKDKKVLKLVQCITQNSDKSKGLRSCKGLPIGNLTSQFFANVYLDLFDHFMKDELGIKYYIRYMDDIVVFADSKNCLKQILKYMKDYLGNTLFLSLNSRATLLNSRLHGLPFLGLRIFPNLIRIKSENLKRIKKKLNMREFEYNRGLINEDRFVMSVRSMVEHMASANSFKLRGTIFSPRAGVS